MPVKKAPVALIILDGWGCSPKHEHNAVYEASTPNMDGYSRTNPHTTLKAHGEAVGIPEWQMGDSNVGHLNLGAGRIVWQDLVRISKSIREGDFFENPAIVGAVDAALASGSALHLMGLVSPGGVHSHSEHLYALLEMAKRRGLDRVFVHAFLDGRDVPPQSAKEYVAALEAQMSAIGVGQIATICGRYYAMDRDNRWDRVERAYNALAYSKGLTASTAQAAIDNSYAKGANDEFVEPTVIVGPDGKAVAAIGAKDSVFFFNFRQDRAREITRAFVDAEFGGFPRREGRLDISFATMTQYDATLTLPYAYSPMELKNILAEVLASHGKTQVRIAETEKYAHVTFFFNGGGEQPYAGEDRVLIPSPKVATYDLQPEMSAYQVADAGVAAVSSGKYDCVIMNFANGDMVGHTGVETAAVKAVSVVDECLGRVVKAIRALGGSVVITADHGNSECMVDSVTGEPYTAHTLNPVPCVVISDYPIKSLREGGMLGDIAPTLLELLGIGQPPEMTGATLIMK